LKAHTYTEREGFWGVSPLTTSQHKVKQLCERVSVGKVSIPWSRELLSCDDDVKTIYWPPRCVFNDTISATQRYTSVGTKTRLRNGHSKDRRSNPGRGKRHFSCPEPPTQSVPWAISPRVRQMELEDDYSPQSSIKVKNAWSYTSIVPYVFPAQLSKHTDNFRSLLPLIFEP
jgi:hypothetical protein